MLQPKHILEFGSGCSTRTMAMHKSVKMIHSLEHDKKYYDKFNEVYFDNVQFIYEPNLDSYACYKPTFKPDFIFVDGRNRARCLSESKTYGVPVMLHDASREKYQDAIGCYKHKVVTDDGDTVTLTDSDNQYKALSEVLSAITI